MRRWRRLAAHAGPAGEAAPESSADLHVHVVVHKYCLEHRIRDGDRRLPIRIARRAVPQLQQFVIVAGAELDAEAVALEERQVFAVVTELEGLVLQWGGFCRRGRMD